MCNLLLQVLQMVSIVLRGVVVLVVERGVSRRPMHHLRRLTIHHVAHACVRTIRPARTCVRRENCVNEVRSLSFTLPKNTARDPK